MLAIMLARMDRTELLTRIAASSDRAFSRITLNVQIRELESNDVEIDPEVLKMMRALERVQQQHQKAVKFAVRW